MAEDRGAFGKFLDYLTERVIPEIGQAIDHKIEQGASELAQTLITNGNSPAYLPYGMNSRDIGTGQEAETSYTEMLRDAARSAPQEQSQDRGIDP